MRLLKKFSILIIICLIIIGLSRGLVVEAAGAVSQGSSIGGVLLEDLSNDEAKMLLQEQVANWLAGEALIAESEHEIFEIPRTIFEFDIEASLASLNEKTKRSWSSFFLKKKNVQIPFIVNVKEMDVLDWPEHIDVENTLSSVSTIASNLGEESVEITYLENQTVEQEELAEVRLPLPDISNAVTGHLAEELNGYVMPANSSFSFLESVKLLDGMANSNAERSFVASALYALVLQTNLEIIERFSQGDIPGYTEAGIEVEINEGESKDFLIYNPNDQPFTITAELIENDLLMTIESVPTPRTYRYVTENEVEIEPKTIYRYSPDLPLGAEELIQSGESGLQIEVYRISTHEDGSSEQELVSRDFYPPTPEIILVSTKEGMQPELNDMLDSELEGLEIPENTSGLDLNGLLNGTETTDDEASEENKMNTSELLLHCIMKNNAEDNNSEETNENQEDTNEEDQVADLCDVLFLYMLSNMADGTTPESEEDGKSGYSLEELLKKLSSELNEDEVDTEEEVLK
ncbi:G5 domain-containing protein [Oceanobacillus bengalensis]|uniref:G5 domain-containing protein n=1 Tax=Oceanobacillus bengalensis TaxID=1435466 RepID=A0A494YWP7_9BACI|nr:G5 domain-containing protein [Oceanobacillus bengalensis]RKQ14649.1 hypothetical protein D8M05_12475 [Oceanobacillus bengalensis]